MAPWPLSQTSDSAAG